MVLTRLNCASLEKLLFCCQLLLWQGTKKCLSIEQVKIKKFTCKFNAMGDLKESITTALYVDSLKFILRAHTIIHHFRFSLQFSALLF